MEASGTSDNQGTDGCAVYELRQYTLRPGQRDVLISLFDREFVETQEAVGMRVVGQFRDLDRPNRFVWVRGFRDMAARPAALAAFYDGPVWKQHGAAANATMIDSDNVLLLRPAGADLGFPPASGARPAPGSASPPGRSIIAAMLYYPATPIDVDLAAVLTGRLVPLLAQTGARPLAVLELEPAENNYPGLPVRTGEQVVAVITAHPNVAEHGSHLARLAASPGWRDEVQPHLAKHLAGPPEQLRLAPTARSDLR